MAETTGISWADSTFNAWIGCAKISPGCDHCYAEVATPSRTLGVAWGPKAPRHRTSAQNWQLPVRWNAAHAAFHAEHGRHRRVFCASLSDVFDTQAPRNWREDLWRLIDATPHLDWLLVTKRIGNVAPWIALYGMPANVWLGITVVDQEEADRDIPKLQRIRAAARFVSMEPLLAPVSVRAHLHTLDWVIVGGESGQRARSMDLRWALDLRDQCHAADVPFFFKQRGGTDKDKGGCLLDGAPCQAWPRLAGAGARHETQTVRTEVELWHSP